MKSITWLIWISLDKGLYHTSYFCLFFFFYIYIFILIIYQLQKKNKIQNSSTEAEEEEEEERKDGRAWARAQIQSSEGGFQGVMGSIHNPSHLPRMPCKFTINFPRFSQKCFFLGVLFALAETVFSQAISHLRKKLMVCIVLS